MARNENKLQRLSDAAAIYRYQGDTTTALKIEAVLWRLDNGRPVRVVDLDAAEELARAVTSQAGSSETDDCDSCGESDEACPKSQRPCGHHCNHSWSHDACCWCGAEFGENGSSETDGGSA